MKEIAEKNKMGRWGAVSYIIGAIIGIIATLGAFCYVELGTSIRKSGSDFAYLCHVRWNKIAFIFMSTSCLFINPCGLAIQIETYVKFIGIEFCDESTLLLFFINCFSLRHVVSRVQIISVIAKFVASDVQFNNFYHPFENTNLRPGNIALALFGGLYSYDGWDILNYGIEDLFAEKTMGPHFKYLIALLVCIVLIGSINASLFGGSRFLWASARERHLPAFFSCINREHDSPRAALFVHIIRSITMLCLFNIRFNICKRPVHEKAIRVPLILPIIFFFKSSIVGLLILAIGLAIYILFIWEKAFQRFGVYRRLSNYIN
uniref:Amino acid transporter n=1 Tax=Meloidogyne javanica TaxID=6303 RepID=A0A915N1M5_MELJA